MNYLYSRDIFKIALEYSNLQVIKWIIGNKLRINLNIKIPIIYF
jgi:hypothetical protein